MIEKRRRQKDPGVKQNASDSSEDNKARSSPPGCEHVKHFKWKAKNWKENHKAVCKACTSTAKKGVEDGENTCVEPTNSGAGQVDLSTCLFCATVGCGEKGSNHALEHSQKTFSDCHDFAVDLEKWTIWCFKCEKEIEYPKVGHINTIKKKFASPVFKSGKNRVPKQEAKTPCEATPFLNKQITNKPLLVKGLVNLGNTCFYNSVLQCLAQTPYLVPVLERLSIGGEKFTILESNEVERLEGELSETKVCPKHLTVPLLDLLKAMRNGEGNNLIRPDNLLQHLERRYEQFKGRDQHDAHELLRHLLEGVRTDDLKRYQREILQYLDCYGKVDTVSPEKAKLVKSYGRLANDLSLGPDVLFRGQLISTLECQDCKSSSTRTENFLDLSLPVTEEKPLPPARKKEVEFSSGPWKHQLKKEKKMAKKIAKRGRSKSAAKQSANEESGLSDADVEDNVEPDTSLLEGKNDVSESGYSSEKAQNPHSESASPAESGCSFVESPQAFAPHGEQEENIAPLKEDAQILGGPNRSDSGLNSCSSLPLLKLSPSPVASSPPIIPLTSAHDRGEITGNAADLDTDAQREDMPKCSPSESGAMAQLPLDMSDLEQKLRLLATESVETEAPDPDPDPGDQDESAKEAGEPAPAPVRDGAGASSQTSWHHTLAPLVASEGECSLISCLRDFTHVEIMNGSNKVGCDNCTRNRGKDGRTVYTTSTKQLLISAPPAVLILQLKRFIAETCRLKKMNRHVSFPFFLDLAPFCSIKCRELPSISSDQSKILYSLYGVVEHSGQMYGGHYVAYVKVRPSLGDQDPRWNLLAPGRPFLQERPSLKGFPEDSSVKSWEEKWYYISDSHVSLVDEQRVRRSQAYLLFYERVV